MAKRHPSNYIPNVTVNNLVDMSFMDMLDGISPYVLEEVPEVSNKKDLEKIDKLLARFANLYAYLLHLYSFVAYEARKAKASDLTHEWKELVRKKEALHELASGVKMKWKACSRLVTFHLKDNEVFDRVDYENRNKGMKGWKTV